MRHTAILIAASAMLGAIPERSTAQRPEPINTINESGLDIGQCAAGGSMSYPSAPYKGTAFFLRKANATLAARHNALTAQSPSNTAWLRRLDGPSAANRLFTAPGGERAFVLWSCKPHDCGANFAYGAYNLATAEYQLQIGPPLQVEQLGSDTPVLRAAIDCARSLDDSARQRAEQALKKLPGS